MQFDDTFDDEPTQPDRWTRTETAGRTRTWLAALLLRLAAWILGARRRDHRIVEAARRSDPRLTMELPLLDDADFDGRDTIPEAR